MSKGEAHKEWLKENVMQITIRPNKKYDADIIQAITRAERNGESKSGAALRYIRLGIQSEYGK